MQCLLGDMGGECEKASSLGWRPLVRERRGWDSKVKHGLAVSRERGGYTREPSGGDTHC